VAQGGDLSTLKQMLKNRADVCKFRVAISVNLTWLNPASRDCFSLVGARLITNARSIGKILRRLHKGLPSGG